MTDRAEIERLLNQTGRTLEGLPTQDDYWYSDNYVDRNEEIGMMMYRSGFKRNEPYIMHQSDVIELLVGALRDALEAQQSKWISIEESKPKEFVSVQVYMTDAGDFPSVREGYYVDVDRFYIPALHEFHPVSHWKPFDEPPEENE